MDINSKTHKFQYFQCNGKHKKRGDIYDTQINQVDITNSREYQNNMVNDRYNFMDMYED